ncbi:hypothetical protein DFJ77DRAFT_246137 [Powellomyces hirtus]|nr:hypothetical protein DFJ77DRAFT_246137 [Powellomyces hirtus]
MSSSTRANFRSSSASPKKKTVNHATLTPDVIETYRVAPFTLPTSRRSSKNTFYHRDPELLQHELHTSKTKINELIYERKVLKTKICALEEELRKMDARYEELLSINIITRTASTSFVDSSATIPEDKTIRNLRIAVKNLTKRNKELDKELGEVKQSMRFNKLYMKEQECVALFQETLRLRRAIANAEAEVPLKLETATELDDLRHTVEIAHRERDEWRELSENLQTEKEALRIQLGEAESKCRLAQQVLEESEHKWRSDKYRECNALKSTNDELEKRVDTLRSEQRDAETDAKAARQRSKEEERILQDELTRARAIAEESKAKEEHWRAQVNTHKVSIAEYEGQVEEYQRQLEETSQIRAHEVNEASALMSRIKRTERVLDEEKSKNEELRQRVEQLQERLDTSSKAAKEAELADEDEKTTPKAKHPQLFSRSPSGTSLNASVASSKDITGAQAPSRMASSSSSHNRHDAQPQPTPGSELPITAPEAYSHKNVPASPTVSKTSASGSRTPVPETSPLEDDVPEEIFPVHASQPTSRSHTPVRSRSPSTHSLNLSGPPSQASRSGSQSKLPDPDPGDFQIHLSRAVSTEFFEKQMRVDAATVIQAAIRGYLTRRARPSKGG